MSDLAQGFVEVTSYVAAFEAADAMAKAANVTIRQVHKVDGPIVCIICDGDVAACQAAVDAATSLCQPKGTLRAVNVIARPGEGQDVYGLLNAINAKKAAKKKAKLEARRGMAAPEKKAPAPKAASAKPAGK